MVKFSSSLWFQIGNAREAMLTYLNQPR